jgi:hypothetical protein
MSIDNLRLMLERTDAIDMREGKLAYERYNEVMRQIADLYQFEISKVIAAFVSLSPNSDYAGNLRSTISVLDGIRSGTPCEYINVSTYKHCRNRAFAYATGARVFLEETKGPKITNFYHNLLDPQDSRFVTIDGHMVAAWKAQNLTMKEALVSARGYREIAGEVKRLAFENYMLPNQLQAVLWFTHKRLANSKYDPQGSLFNSPDDLWNTSVDVSSLRPYRTRKEP